MNLFQKFVGLLACVLCIFILGPIAFVINVARVCRSWLLRIPADYEDLRAVTPMFVVFLLLILAWVAVSQI